MLRLEDEGGQRSTFKNVSLLKRSIDLNRGDPTRNNAIKTRPRSHSTRTTLLPAIQEILVESSRKAGSKVSSGLKERFEDKIKVEKEGNGLGCAQGEDDS